MYQFSILEGNKVGDVLGNLKYYRYFNFFIVVFIVSVPFLQAFSVPIPGSYAIKIDDDSAIDSAILILQDNTPNINVIEYDSLKYHLFLHRIIQPIVWIGHGSTQGIQINNKLQSWSDFSKDVVSTPGIDVILSCNSYEIIK